MNKLFLYFVLSILIVKGFNKLCSEESGNSDIDPSECKKLEVADSQNICIKGDSGCEEQKSCEHYTNQDENDCSNYPTLDGYECIKNDDNNCEKQQINCGQEGDGNGSSYLCRLLKVNDDEHTACVKDEIDPKCIVATNCQDVKLDATDEICEKLHVEDGKKCLKEGDTCVVKTICDGAAGTSDDDCQNFWVTDSNSKRCAKKDGDDICEEVSKTEENQPNPTPNTQATEAQPTQQQTPNPTPTPTSEASQNTQATQNTQTTQNSQTTSSDTTSSTTKATKSSNLSSADRIKMSLMVLIIMFIL